MQTLSTEAASLLAEEWLAVYGRNRSGANTNAYLWHVFSADRYPSVNGVTAIEQYKQQLGIEFVVLSNDRKVAVLTDLLPETSSLSDYYVFPPNFAWTMAFTHEDGWLGPYFARHPEFSALDAENQSRLKKAKEVEAARLKGWC
ncbi:DUF4275 family protein [Niveibacterium sp. 24ML]|uniref:DUF4275 family protein n=1 Tax=Niveibacterium sp. 24ML TaxID=2985512 RepID=UPI00227028EB|nr:DUF4275 family protein [Niveibacterium sp. 24ML]MCX9158623.1 DUF4275 family protein [Niveibacterium sp. 24ML]